MPSLSSGSTPTDNYRWNEDDILFPLGQGAVGTTSSYGADTCRVAPVFIPNPCTFQVGAEATVAGGAGGFLQFTVYNTAADGSGPGTLLGANSSIDCTITGFQWGIGTYDIPARGWYWVGGLFTGSATVPTFRSYSNTNDWGVPMPLGSIPSAGQIILSAYYVSPTVLNSPTWLTGGTGAARIGFVVGPPL